MKFAVVGANGRMGQEILAAAIASKEKPTLIGVVRKGKAAGYSTSVNSLEEIKGKLDAVIDFSLPENTERVLKYCQKRKTPLISGVTGISDKSFGNLSDNAKKSPVLWSSNMSLGVALFKKALLEFSNIEDFDVQMVEFHHRNKKDRPSGTAKSIQAHLRKLKSKSLNEPISVRGGGIIGVHQVFMMSDTETLKFEHQAVSRSVFAVGAIKAALWIVGKSPGLYSMDDVLVKSKSGQKSK